MFLITEKIKITLQECIIKSIKMIWQIKYILRLEHT